MPQLVREAVWDRLLKRGVTGRTHLLSLVMKSLVNRK